MSDIDHEANCRWLEKFAKDFGPEEARRRWVVQFQEAERIAEIAAHYRTLANPQPIQVEELEDMKAIAGALYNLPAIRYRDLENGAWYRCLRHDGSRLETVQWLQDEEYYWNGSNEFGCWVPIRKIAPPEFAKEPPP